MRVFHDLWWFFKQEKRSYLLGIASLLIVALLQLIPPKVIGIITDLITNSTLTSKQLVLWMIVLFGAAIIMYVLRYYWRNMIFGSAVKLTRQLRDNLFRHFTTMSQAFYQRKRVGDLMAHATNDLQAIQQTAGVGILTLVDSLATGGSVIIAMAILNWKLTLISLLPMPLMAVLTSWYGNLLHKRFSMAQEAFSSLNDKTQESIMGIKVIKSFGQEKEDIEEFNQQSIDVVKKNLSVAKIDALYDPTISIIVAVSFFLAVSFGVKFVFVQALSIGELITFTTYLGLLIWPMLAFGWLFNIVERGRASYDRIKNLLAEPVEITDHPEGLNQVPTGDITFAVHHFTYSNTSVPDLKNIHFNLKKGTTLGITGRTGSGKTTLLKILIREFEGLEGDIYIGGIPINQYKIEKLREAVGYVPQEHFLFSSTIAENIAFSKPNAALEEIQHAASLAQIDQDITYFSHGYDTIVGERGVSLSGGQKQRISIARALIMDPEILILDDSLSAVDAKTEEGLLSSLRKSRENKTTIITAHRLSSIQHAELILVLDEGIIVQRGNHNELMKQDGWYREMYLHQQLEELVEKGG